MTSSTLFNSVLLVEDDSAHALLIKRALKGFVQELRVANSVAEGEALLREWKPDLIISDLNLPDSKGMAHVEKLKIASADSPIIVLTSSNSISDAVKAMQLGARDFLVKNFDNNFHEILGLALSRLCTNLLMEEERRRLERETAALRRAIESSNDGLAVVTMSGQVLYCNSGFSNIVEQCAGDASNILQAFSPKVKDAGHLCSEIESHLKSLSAGGVWSSEFSLLNNKDAAFGLSLSILDPQTESTATAQAAAVIWIRDVSEQKRRERFQREILSATTHDLKGPLGTISLCAEMLQETLKGEGKAFELSLRVASSSKGALNLIDEFLSARRIQEGTFILKPAEVELNELVTSTTQEYSAMARAKNIELVLEVPNQTAIVKVDRLGLVRVIGNLLSNAIKFTPKGGKISVGVKIDAHDYQIAVEDTGSGMEPASVHKLFERYSRLSEHRGIEGTGLGLFVVKSIVTAHNGKIQVASKVGQGSRFTVVMPVDPPVNERGEVVSLDFKV